MVIWGIHAGRTGDAETLFLKKNFVALGWPRIGDLSQIAPDREAFKARVSEIHPDKSPPAVANNAGQLFRFMHEMKVGDLVVFPSKSDHHVNIGRVAGAASTCPSRLTAIWSKHFGAGPNR